MLSWNYNTHINEFKNNIQNKVTAFPSEFQSLYQATEPYSLEDLGALVNRIGNEVRFDEDLYKFVLIHLLVTLEKKDTEPENFIAWAEFCFQVLNHYNLQNILKDASKELLSTMIKYLSKVENIETLIRYSVLAQKLNEYEEINYEATKKYIGIVSKSRMMTLLKNSIENKDFQSTVQKAWECFTNDVDIGLIKQFVADFCMDWIRDTQDKDRNQVRTFVGYLNAMKDELSDLQKTRLDQIITDFPPIEPKAAQPVQSQSAQHQHSAQNIVVRERSQIYSRNVIYAQNFPNHIVNVVRGKVATPDGELEVAVKEYLSSTPGYINKFKGEINIIKKFSGIKECFLKYYGDYLTQEEDKEVLGIVMEYCPYQFIDDITLRGQEGRYYTEQEIYVIAHQLTEGFSQLHEQKLAHKDIKPHNIFISKEGYIKIADFNISEQGASTTQINATGIFKVQGTDGYMAPELQDAYLTQKASNQKTNVRYKPLKADVYSLGLTILQVYTLQNVKGYNTEFRQGELTQIINSIPYPWLREFLSRALQFEYKNRPKMKELLMYLNFKDTTGLTHANY